MPTLSPNQVNNSDVVDYVYVANRHSLHWQTSEITDWRTFIDAADASTLFDGNMLDNLEPIFGEMTGVILGREFSGVLYFFIPMWEHHKIDYKAARTKRIDDGLTADPTPDRLLTLGERLSLAQRVLDLTSSANELTVLAHATVQQNPDLPPTMGDPVDYDVESPWAVHLDSSPYRIRAWWD